MAGRLKLITVCETADFVKRAAKVWDISEREAFIDYIAANPTDGDVIEGTGGVRKVRWSRGGTGKRGGVRVIYYFYDASLPLFLLTLFAKAESDDLSAEGKRIYRDFATNVKRMRGRDV